MPSESGVLKRKRSRPSEWWASAPSPSVVTPSTATASQSKTRVRISNVQSSGVDSLKVTTGNRGRRAKGKEKEEGVAAGIGAAEELEGGDTENDKSLEKSKPTTGVYAGTSQLNENAGKNKGTKRGRPAKITKEAMDTRLVPDNSKQPVKEGIGSETGTSSRRINKRKELHQPSSGLDNSSSVLRVSHTNEPNKRLRKGRSSNTEAELQAPVSYKETKTRKPAQSSSNRPKTRPNEQIASALVATKSQTKRQPAEQHTAPQLSLRRGRSSNTEAELGAINYKEAKTVRRGEASNPKPASAVTASSQKQRDEASTKGISSQSQIQRKTSKVQSRKSDASDATQVASSKLTRRRSNGKSYVKPVDISKPKARKDISNVKSKSRIQSAPTKPDNPTVPGNKSKSSRPDRSDGRKRKAAQGPRPQSPKHRRVEQPVLDEPAIARREKVPRYQHLVPVTRRVSRNTIQDKWDKLPPSAVDQIEQLLQDVQRSVTVRFSDDRKRDQATTALQWVSRRLVTKIRNGLPFPQGTHRSREDDFDFEKVLETNRALEALLTPTLHANELLESELSKERALLETEKKDLVDLETNAKAETSQRKQAGRKLHALLRPDGLNEDLDPEIGYDEAESSRPLDTILPKDDELQGIVQELQGHVDSIEGNMKQVKGISEAMAKSKAALQETLYFHLESTRYDEVVLG